MPPARLAIAVAGCGPAGLAASLFLHRAGHKVTLFDQFDEPRALGSGLILQPTGLAVLAELGLAAPIMALGRRIDRLFGRVLPSQKIVLDVCYRDLGRDSFGIAVHRGALFRVLFNAVVREGIAIETARTVEAVERAEGARFRLLCKGGRPHSSFDLVVDALGARSPLARAYRRAAPRRELAYGALWASVPWAAAGLDAHALEQRYRRASMMVGVLPIGRQSEGGEDLAAFFWSVKPRAYEAWRAAGLSKWKDEVASLWPEVAPLLACIDDPDELTLARYGHHTLGRPVADGLAAIGDAAHATSPQLGQGANMALLDAWALAAAVASAADAAGALSAYASLRRWHVRFYQALSFAFTPFYQSDSRLLPVLRDHAVAPLTRWPGLRRMTAAMVAGTLLNPGPRLSEVALRPLPPLAGVPEAGARDG